MLASFSSRNMSYRLIKRQPHLAKTNPPICFISSHRSLVNVASKFCLRVGRKGNFGPVLYKS